MSNNQFLQNLLKLLVTQYGIKAILAELHYALMDIPLQDNNSTAQEIWNIKKRHENRECKKCGGDSGPGHYCM